VGLGQEGCDTEQTKGANDWLGAGEMGLPPRA
jgi:hypothetical protein